jgi:hypothetical protein
MSIEDRLFALLRVTGARRLRAHGALAARAVARHQACEPACEGCETNAELVVVGGVLETLDPESARQLLARLRLFEAPRLLVAARAAPLGPTDFLALGMQCLDVAADDGWALYEYDLATYKPAPDWLNARFWANPERWQA